MKISNNYITATFKAHGAELVSLKKENREYIWQAEAAHWNRHAPVLFPIVGKLKNNRYHHKGKTYEMGQHGFARDKVFEIAEHTSDHISFELRSDSSTLKIYPFEFRLTISYHLNNSSLKVSYKVENTSLEEMYFSIGGHPGFNCPVDYSEKRRDYWLDFDQAEPLKTHLLEGGNFSGETEKINLDGTKLQISDSLFDKDALVLKHLASQNISLISPIQKWFTFHFDGFPYLGIWSKSQESPFVCIEPWYGLADNETHDGDLSKKEGIRKLKPSSVFSASYSVEIH